MPKMGGSSEVKLWSLLSMALWLTYMEFNQLQNSICQTIIHHFKIFCDYIPTIPQNSVIFYKSSHATYICTTKSVLSILHSNYMWVNLLWPGNVLHYKKLLHPTLTILSVIHIHCTLVTHSFTMGLKCIVLVHPSLIPLSLSRLLMLIMGYNFAKNNWKLSNSSTYSPSTYMATTNSCP